MSSQVCSRVIISGKVQGVFFRAETDQMARRTGVSGWVRNRPDGTVEALFCGSREKVDEAIAWCRRGSAASRVSDVQVFQETDAEAPPDFSIRY